MPHVSLHSRTGELTVFEDAGKIVSLDWGRAPNPETTPLLKDAAEQLRAYFDGSLKNFDLPLNPAGTSFQQKVWQQMQVIPYGKTRTYGELASRLNSGPRPVGGACGRNPIPIIIPCHRVVGGAGLGGYSGAGGLETKKTLLVLEGALTSSIWDR